MDLSKANIPAFFWYAIGVALLSATLGVLAIAYRSSSVSIEIADAKISLSGAISETEDLARKLEKENAELRHAREEVEKKVKELQAIVDARGPAPKLTPEELKTLSTFAKNLPPPEPAERFSAVQTDLRNLRDKVKKTE